MKRKWLFILLALLIILPGCSKGTQPTALPSAPSSVKPSSSPTPSANQSPSPTPQTMNVAVYYLKESNNNLYLVREVHTIGKSEGIAKAALNELISGNVQTKGAYRVIPADTKILGVSIANGIATVDFSKEVLKANVGSAGEELGIMSIVNTLTEFPTVSSVQFTVEGNAGTAKDWWGHVGLSNQPFKRNINKVYEPVIWVNSPVSGQKVSSPITLQGTAIIFEATVNYHLKDSAGNLLAEGYVMANAGAPDRGEFQKSIEFKPSTAGKGTLEVFEVSPKDGSEINKVVIPLSW